MTRTFRAKNKQAVAKSKMQKSKINKTYGGKASKNKIQKSKISKMHINSSGKSKANDEVVVCVNKNKVKQTNRKRTSQYINDYYDHETAKADLRESLIYEQSIYNKGKERKMSVYGYMFRRFKKQLEFNLKGVPLADGDIDRVAEQLASSASFWTGVNAMRRMANAKPASLDFYDTEDIVAYLATHDMKDFDVKICLNNRVL